MLPKNLPKSAKGLHHGGPKCLWLREAPVGIEPTNGGFADLCLTTWLRRRGIILAISGAAGQRGRLAGKCVQAETARLSQTCIHLPRRRAAPPAFAPLRTGPIGRPLEPERDTNHHRSRRGYGAARDSGGPTEAGVRGSVSRHRAGRLASRHNGRATATAVAPREGDNPAGRAIDGGGTLRISGRTTARRTKRRPNPSRRPLAVNELQCRAAPP
jgi:hypothetical protein